MIERKSIETADFGALDVIRIGGDWYEFLVNPRSPRAAELWEAAVKLAAGVRPPSYPFRFDSHEINHKGGNMSEKPITIDMVVEAYVSTRNEIARLKKEYEDKESVLKGYQEKREEWLAAQMDAMGQTSAKTPHGTCFFTRKESVTVGDWDAVLGYIIENGAYELLERRVSKAAVLDMMGEDRDQTPPPGTNYVGIRTVNIRKA